MKKELFDELLASVKQAKAIKRGEMKPGRAFRVTPQASVVQVRGKLGLSQSKFATLLGISQDTLQNWEQGRRAPTGPAKVLLKIATKHPEVLLEVAESGAGARHLRFTIGKPDGKTRISRIYTKRTDSIVQYYQ